MMNLKDAQEEAYMLKVITAGGKAPSYVHGFDKYKRPRAKEEYDEALAAVEALKLEVEREPLSKKILSEIIRLSIIAGYYLYAVPVSLLLARMR